MLNKNIYDQYQHRVERVLQFGEGNFLRAFADWMIDKINNKCALDLGVVVVQPIERGLIDVLNDQDGLYTLYQNGIMNNENVNEYSIINCITRGINPYRDYDGYLKTAENENMRIIISNTTEAGIAVDENDRLNQRPQNSFPGKLTAWLYHRYKTFNGDKDKGMIIIPCELIDRNGDKLKAAIERYIQLWSLEEGFAQWLDKANIFCNTLVDRIVPGFPRDRINEIYKELGYEDKLVVESEPFHLWVIEGPNSVKEEFPADKAGLNVLFVDDMTPYRTRKVRILNGAHTTMVPVSYLYGLNTVKESVEDEVMGRFVKEAIFDEIIPTLDLPENELKEYAATVLERFRNPYIKHRLISISLNSMSKYRTRVLPSLIEYVKRKGQLPKKLVFSLAALIKFYKGERNEEKIELRDNEDILNLYKDLWSKYDGSDEHLRHIVSTVLAYERNWGANLNEIEGLTDLVTQYLIKIEKLDIDKALDEVM